MCPGPSQVVVHLGLGLEALPEEAEGWGGLATALRARKKLKPAEFRPSQGQAPYRQLLPGIVQVPADWLIAWGRKNSMWPP